MSMKEKIVAAALPKQKKTCFSSTTQSGFKYAVAWVAYVLIGSWVFLVLERTTDTNLVEHEKWTKFKELLTVGNVVEELHVLRSHLLHLCPHHSFNSSFEELVSSSANSSGYLTLQQSEVRDWIEETRVTCNTSLTIVEEIVSHPEWSFIDAIYYTMTLVTTIGFGHIYPTTDMGKVFSVVFAIAGVPLTCIFIAKSSDVLSNKMLHLYESTKKRSGRQPQTVLLGVTWIFLILGCLVFMYLPSLAFAAIEDWSYIDSIYFTFITLSTIGFGEFIAGYNDKPEDKTYSDIYKILIVVWIMVALAYWILLLNFLQKAIKSNAKTLKKTFKGKNISKQAEFLRQLMAKMNPSLILFGPKVKQQQSESAIDNEERLHMMAMMVESLTMNSSSMSKLSRRKSSDGLYSMKPTLSRLSSMEGRSGSDEQRTIQIDVDDLNDGRKGSEVSSKLPLITFKDLMNINVALKTETLPTIESLVAVADAGSKQQQSLCDFMKIGQQDSLGPQKLSDEVTLPLRDVIGVVLLVASMDENQNDTEDDEDNPSDYTNTLPIVDPKESMPLLRSIFLNLDEDESSDKKKLSHDKETIKNAYFESALNHYLEECEEATDKDYDMSDDEALRKKKNMIV